MKRLLLNLILLMTTIVGSVYLLTYNVYASESDEIPENYTKQNIIVSWSKTGKIDGVTSTTTYYCYDFDLYYPSEYDIMLSYNQGYRNASLTGIFINRDNNDLIASWGVGGAFTGGSNIYETVVKNTETGHELEITIYVKLNSAIKTVDNDEKNVHTCTNLDTLDFSDMWQSTSSDNNTYISYPYMWNTYGTYYDYYGMIGNFDYSNPYFFLDEDKMPASFYECAVIAYAEYEKLVKIYKADEIQYPSLSHAILIPSGRLMLYYNFDPNKRAPIKYYVYNKIYVKLRNEDWIAVDNNSLPDEKNPYLLTFSKDNATGSLSGHISMKELTQALGRETATYEAIIWGIQYAYGSGVADKALSSGIIKKTDWYFSRYVFEENLIDGDVEVSVNDLGDLTNISGGSSSIVVDTPNGSSGGGSGNGSNPTYGTPNIIIDDKSVNSISDFINTLKWDFTSISKAISSVFSLVIQFASFIGNVFTALFGEPFYIIVMLALGCAIILRVVGR